MKFIPVIFLLLFAFSSCSENSTTENVEKKLYTCSMHPQIIRDQPGNCPICGMKLVEKMKDGNANSEIDLALSLKPTNEYVIGDFKTVSLKKEQLNKKIMVDGVITYDTREKNMISARVDGRIDKLYVKYEFQPIYKGQKIMEIYSKELSTYQEELLFLLKNDANNELLIKAAEKKLILLGLTQKQIDQLKENKTTINSLTIYSPYSGHLHSMQNENIEAGSAMKMDMAGSSNMNNPILLREGMYFSKGENILSVYSVRNVWALINIPNEFIGDVNLNMPVSLSIDGFKNKEWEAKIDFIEPEINDNQKTSSARIYLKNPNGELKIGTIVHGVIEVLSEKSFFIPSTAVLNLGRTNIVFVKAGDVFKSRQVELGSTVEGKVEIISGVDEKDEIVLNGQMLMDSESFVKINSNE